MGRSKLQWKHDFDHKERGTTALTPNAEERSSISVSGGALGAPFWQPKLRSGPLGQGLCERNARPPRGLLAKGSSSWSRLSPAEALGAKS